MAFLCKQKCAALTDLISLQNQTTALSLCGGASPSRLSLMQIALILSPQHAPRPPFAPLVQRVHRGAVAATHYSLTLSPFRLFSLISLSSWVPLTFYFSIRLCPSLPSVVLSLYAFYIPPKKNTVALSPLSLTHSLTPPR